MEKQINIGDSLYSVTSDDNYLDVMGNDFEPHMVQLFRALVGPDDVVADIRTELMRPEVSPGETIEQQIRIEAPKVPGKFRLIVTMLQEGVCWFEDRGFEAAALDFEVA